jgi:hypothetical protein
MGFISFIHSSPHSNGCVTEAGGLHRRTVHPSIHPSIHPSCYVFRCSEPNETNETIPPRSLPPHRLCYVPLHIPDPLSMTSAAISSSSAMVTNKCSKDFYKSKGRRSEKRSVQRIIFMEGRKADRGFWFGGKKTSNEFPLVIIIRHQDSASWDSVGSPLWPIFLGQSKWTKPLQ